MLFTSPSTTSVPFCKSTPKHLLAPRRITIPPTTPTLLTVHKAEVIRLISLEEEEETTEAGIIGTEVMVERGGAEGPVVEEERMLLEVRLNKFSSRTTWLVSAVASLIDASCFLPSLEG